MLSLKSKSTPTSLKIGRHSFLKLELVPEEYGNLVQGLIDLLPDHYVDPASIVSTLERLGKPAAAEKLRQKIPEAKRTRSGDIGEALATDYIEEETEYSVPIKKLRWRDVRDMPMRGDDIIGVLVSPRNETLKFLKAEAKGNQRLSREVLNTARKELDTNGGKPTPHALAFVAERLREMGSIDLSDRIEKAQLVTGIAEGQVQHLLFTVSETYPSKLQEEALGNYTGPIHQQSIGFRVSGHQNLISSVYEGILDGLND